MELEKIYQSAKCSNVNFVYTNKRANIIKIIKLIKDILTKRIFELGNNYEKNEFTKIELESFMN